MAFDVSPRNMNLNTSSLQEYLKEDPPFSPIERPRPRRRARLTFSSICKLLYVLSIRGFLVVGLVVVGSALWTATQQLSSNLFTHRKLYQNQTLHAIMNISSVVRPLIDQEQLFDIAVSVWIRAPEEEERERKKSLMSSESGGEEMTDEDDIDFWANAVDGPEAWRKYGLDYNFTPRDPSQLQQIPSSFEDPDQVLYHPLYSDIVFRRLRLSDMSVFSSRVNFTVPTKKFRDKKLRGDELKAVFMLIPTSPSPMDYVTNFSSWISDEVWNNMTARRTWPFPLGSEYRREKTFAEQAVERLSFAMPLIRFHEIPSRCPSEDNGTSSENVWFRAPAPNKEHPHIITRTHARIFKEFELMNFEAYKASHTQIKNYKCGFQENVFQMRRGNLFALFCIRDYRALGNLETMFELAVPLEDGSTRTEWAYGPYMDKNLYAVGPKDYVHVPVNRENCTLNESTVNAADGKKVTFNFTESDSIDISWHISFSAELPTKQLIHDVLGTRRKPADHTASDFKKLQGQDAADLWAGIWGIRRDDDSHPRRRVFLQFLFTFSSSAADYLDLLYWYTRSTTVFISVSGTILSAVGLFINSDFITQGRGAWSVSKRLLWNYHPYFLMFRERVSDSSPMMRFMLTSLPHTAQAVLMLMISLKLEFGWLSAEDSNWIKRWIPTMRRLRSTHKERASERLERSIMQWRTRFAILVILFLIYHFVPPHTHNIIAPLHPIPDPSDIEVKKLYKDIILTENIVQPLLITGSIFQLVLNHRSGFYAGRYRIATIFRTVGLLAALLCYVPWVLGRVEMRGGLTVHEVLRATLLVIETWQALTLPRAPAGDYDEDEE